MIPAIIRDQVESARPKAIQGWQKGTGTMTSWIIIIFGYVVIAVAVFNLVGGSAFHPLFLD